MSNLKLIILEVKCKEYGEKTIVSLPMHITDEGWKKTKEEISELIKCKNSNL